MSVVLIALLTASWLCLCAAEQVKGTFSSVFYVTYMYLQDVENVWYILQKIPVFTMRLSSVYHRELTSTSERVPGSHRQILFLDCIFLTQRE